MARCVYGGKEQDHAHKSQSPTNRRTCWARTGQQGVLKFARLVC